MMIGAGSEPVGEYPGHEDGFDVHDLVISSMIPTLRDAVEQEFPASVLAAIIFQLCDYMRFHMKEEEALMEFVGYPLRGQHGLLHDGLLAEATGLLEAHLNRELLLNQLEVLEESIKVHIEIHDSLLHQACRRWD